MQHRDSHEAQFPKVNPPKTYTNTCLTLLHHTLKSQLRHSPVGALGYRTEGQRRLLPLPSCCGGGGQSATASVVAIFSCAGVLVLLLLLPPLLLPESIKEPELVWRMSARLGRRELRRRMMLLVILLPLPVRLLYLRIVKGKSTRMMSSSRRLSFRRRSDLQG